MSTEVTAVEAIHTTSPIVPTGIAYEEIDRQIATAKRYPRSIKSFLDEAMTMALLDEETAASCFYVMPRAGKNIEGPSVRLAEIIASSWGHLRCGHRFIGETEDRKFVICEGVVWDLQTNTQFTAREVRRITDKYGKRYNDDMIQTTARACASIAFRNAIFKVVPMSYTKMICTAAKNLAVGDAKSLTERRKKMLDWFGKVGVSAERVIAKIGRQSVDDVTIDDLEILIGISTSIKDGDLDIDTAFPVATAAPTESLEAKVKAKAEEQPKATGRGAFGDA